MSVWALPLKDQPPDLKAWIALGAVAVVISAIAWFNGRTPDKMARKNRPPRGGSAGGGGGMGGAGGMDDRNR